MNSNNTANLKILTASSNSKTKCKIKNLIYFSSSAELEQHKSAAAKEGRYGDADAFQSRITQLKKAVIDRKKKDLDQQHAIEMDSLEQTYRKEVEEYNEEWDKKIAEFDEQARSFLDDLKLRHSKEIEIHEANLNKKLFKPSKFSRTFIELKNQEENLVRQQRFKEAQLIKKKADAYERQDAENWTKEKTDKVGTNTDNLKSKQLGEVKALEKKLATQLEVLRKERETGFNVILHRFKNKKYEMEKQQKKEKVLTENESLNKASKNFKFN
jgi:hypothetical protein